MFEERKKEMIEILKNLVLAFNTNEGCNEQVFEATYELLKQLGQPTANRFRELCKAVDGMFYIPEMTDEQAILIVFGPGPALANVPVYLVMNKNNTVLSVRRTKERADESAAGLTKGHVEEYDLRN